ncbi:MAG: hypothetical protein AB7O48_16880 [Cyclobacteriaceae bacterium]
MANRNRFYIIITLCIVTLFAGHDAVAQKRKSKKSKSSRASETVITFKAGQFKECGDSITVGKHSLKVSHLENDSTMCYFGNNEDLLWLYPATLYMKLNRDRAIKEIKVTVNDNCRPECTTANLYNLDGELLVTQSNKLTYEDEPLLFTLPEDFNTMTITSYEGMVKEIRIVYK